MSSLFKIEDMQTLLTVKQVIEDVWMEEIPICIYDEIVLLEQHAIFSRL
jgi:hypothetical protein